MPFDSTEKRPRDPELLAKIAIIQVLESEIQILLQTNSLQKQEIENLKKVAAAQEKEWQEMESCTGKDGRDNVASIRSQEKIKTC